MKRARARQQPVEMAEPTKSAKRRRYGLRIPDGADDSRRSDGSEGSETIPPFKPGNNQFGAIGTTKCYNCRIKKYKVITLNPLHIF
jgi:hypothetical protein